ncbi:hypothetical protein GCQ56_00890 [Marinifilum sp. N1E240]|uniref:helix-turn-helix domain-containing protein n=1 Tax=Marinifilum sp. N1E240 TaxID=2608082 RepID=UPI00128BAA02|nr:hypothetical protein [Marinifilum sp. N1E240]MPQ45548.1 hypothetical protein [Marinifilum sp. N1E240]
MNNFKLIKTKEEYRQAIDRVKYLMGQNPQPNTPIGDELELLAVLINKYEEETFEIPQLNPIEVIEYFLEERSYQRKDLIDVIGDKTIVSRIMTKKRKLTIEMIRKLSDFLSIPIGLLISDYELSS